tara:strand:+ start:100 stop:630 length:531 start_codon:yes stop_codon:yes gene_type:complete
MNIDNLFIKVLLTGLVAVVPLSASNEIGFAGLAAAPPPVQKFSALKEISIGIGSAQKEISADYLIAKLNRLNKEQKKFFIKYESGALNSTKDIAGFKIDLALLEYKTNSILTEVDTYLKSKNYDYQDSLALSKFDKALENEEKMRIKIEALISEMKFKQDSKYYKHRLLYHIKLGK